MKRLQRTIGTMTLLLLGVAVVAAQAEPQFAGSWVLDRSQSQFPTHEGRGHGAPHPQAQPPQVTLMVDFNQVLTVAEAVRRGRLIDEEGGVYWIEEPIRADDFAGAARVAREVATPIQLGENFMGPEQMAQALAAGACDYVMPDAQRIGGVTGWLRAAALAQGAGAEMSSHLFPEVSAHLLAATPTCHWLEYVDWANPVLEQPLELKDGHVIIPSQPGTGIAWDEKAVERYKL